MGKIRVALAEDNVLLREGVSRLVSANEEFELVGTASDLPQLLALVREQQPDVVITDIRMPPTGTNEGIQAAAWLRGNHPEVGVVVLSQYTAPAYAMALLEHGSAGRAYLLKEQFREVFKVKGEPGRLLLKAWLMWASRSKIPAFVKVARKIRRHLHEIGNTLDSGLSNARSEATNTHIRLLTRRAYGYHSADALIAMADLTRGGLCPPPPGR